MKVLVLGGGVIGVSSAYYLAQAGAEVVLLERREAVACETSFANAGQISPGYAAPWAAPGIPFKALKWLFQRHAPLALRPDGSRFQLAWIAALLRQCTPAHYAENKARMMRLAEYSRDCLRALRAETGLSYESRSLGTLQVFRTPAQLAAARRDVAVLERLGVEHQYIESAKALTEFEPALAHAAGLVGGLRLPNDETGDCHAFTTALAARAAQQGVTLHCNTAVERVVTEGGRLAGVQAGGRCWEADAYVFACGSDTRALLAPLGLDLPVYPVKGYSLTAPLLDEAHAPRSTVLDETYKVAITRFDQRIRIGGMAELAGFDLSLNPRRRVTLVKVADELFHGGSDLANAQFWTGLRPMTPDGTPIVGPTRVENLFLNTGHGTLGWTMACGSGRVLADLITGRPPDIPVSDLALRRYHA